VIALRRATADDAGFLAALANDGAVEPFLGLRGPRDPERVVTELRLDEERPEERGWFLIEEDGEPAGGVAFATVNAVARIAHLHGLMIVPSRHGRGLGAEAVRVVALHLVRDLGFHRVEAETYAFNERAQRVFEHAGFVREGVRRLAFKRHGRWNDAVYFGLVAEDLNGD
jgi:RimJ/RimL family protein N-acetyltransferase